ncbi:helix-turn-helix transcriptional regulator [Methanolobus halotolerans]|uniref:Transcriptional regulator n=1 Tax=Methanolobus halotolerans TaxID=2052935 RepID=A0A4E0PWR1_9EURY|nr:winged helix-turn-helix domain-containing protein [Methanolobus halotolerans]TGC08997.1 transcriptional regulator [Methanolobus halotolerans]
MGSSLLEMVWFSEKRRKLLLLLLDGPKSPEEIKKAFGVNWRSLILPLKELREEELILNENGNYQLSVIGKLITESVKPMDEVLNMFEGNTEYWANRNLTAIPQQLRDRIGEIGNYQVIEPDLNHMFDPPEQVFSRLRESGFVYSIFSIYHPLYMPLYCELAEKGTRVSLIVTEPVLERMNEDCKKEKEKMEQLQNTNLFLYRTGNAGMIPPSVVVSDRIFMASFFSLSGKYDHRDVVSFTESSMEWGEELFESYKLRSYELKG